MNVLKILILILLLSITVTSTATARDVKAELQNIQKQRQLIENAQKTLSMELGEVGTTLRNLDVALLSSRNLYRDVRKKIVLVDKHLRKLTQQKKEIRTSMQSLHQQMIKEASAAYQHAGSHSVWVDVLSDTSITEVPHRQFLLKAAMASQEKDRETWRKTMDKLAIIEQEEQKEKEALITLRQERKNAERELVHQIANKKDAAKQLRNSIKKKKAQQRRLIQQEKTLQRLLNGLGDTLLASDKTTKATSIRKQKGTLAWPLKGRILVGFGNSTATGVKLTGVHISPEKRTEKGKLVHAFGQGQIRYADWFGGYGLMMIVDYGHGIMAVYAHNDALHKQLGDWVEKDEVLAEAGSTGWIDDVRLYFEIRDKGKPVSPSRWCKK